MALNAKITKEQYDALPDAIKEHYKGDGAGYVLETDTVPEDVAPLRNALDRTKEELRQLREAQLERERTEADRIRQGILAGGNVDEIRTALEQEREQLRTDLTGQISAKDQIIGRLLVDDRANNIAIKLAGKHSKLILPHIKARLKVDFTGDEPRAVVITEAGQPSTLSIDDLEKEFLKNPDFASILVAVDSSGGGAGRDKGGDASKKPNDYTEAERVELYRTNPTEFHRLFPTKQ